MGNLPFRQEKQVKNRPRVRVRVSYSEPKELQTHYPSLLSIPGDSGDTIQTLQSLRLDLRLRGNTISFLERAKPVNLLGLMMESSGLRERRGVSDFAIHHRSAPD
jgi:hypothetical protein